MNSQSIATDAGRTVFGRDAAGYASGRLDYPKELYDLLDQRCGPLLGARVFEIGPGTGQATQELVARGMRVTAIEPDAQLARLLRQVADEARLEIFVSPFEAAHLPAASFDLGVAATSFGWLDRTVALRKIVDALRPGGWWAMWWNIFSQSGGDAIFDAAMNDLPRPGSFVGHDHYALDSPRVLAELETAGLTDASYTQLTRDIAITPAQLRALYATFSPLRMLPAAECGKRLDMVERMAANEASSGSISRRYATAVYVARRSADLGVNPK